MFAMIMGWFTSKLGNLPWTQIAILTLVVGICGYGVHLIKTVEDLKLQVQQTQDQHKTDLDTISKQQSAMEILKKEKDDEIANAKATQQELDVISSHPSSADGVIRPVVSDTLVWLRQRRATSALNKAGATPK